MLDWTRNATYSIPELFQQLIIHTPFSFLCVLMIMPVLSVVFGSKLDWAGLLVSLFAIFSGYCYHY